MSIKQKSAEHKATGKGKSEQKTSKCGHSKTALLRCN